MWASVRVASVAFVPWLARPADHTAYRIRVDDRAWLRWPLQEPVEGDLPRLAVGGAIHRKRSLAVTRTLTALLIDDVDFKERGAFGYIGLPGADDDPYDP